MTVWVWQLSIKTIDYSPQAIGSNINQPNPYSDNASVYSLPPT